MAIGGDGIVTPTVRSAYETEMGLFWAYDGSARVGVPPGLYNQLALVIARDFDAGSLLRLLTALNVGMADAAIAAWDSKYHYKTWRPVTAIRRAADDGNPMTMPIVDFTPMGAPASNSLGGTPFTPPFPAYPSGHATFGAVLFETLRRAFGRDTVTFTFVSTELDGRTQDSSGRVRPFSPHTFDSFSEAEESNGFSRFPLGIHWQFDKTAGIKMGRQVADVAVRALLE